MTLSEHLVPRGPTAVERAQQRWFTIRCDFCQQTCKSKGGLTTHLRRCWKNPEARQYVTGEYEMLTRNGRFAGFVWNGENEEQRKAIRAGFNAAATTFGFNGVGA